MRDNRCALANRIDWSNGGAPNRHERCYDALETRSLK
jgi:hypothetical protein